MVAEQVLQLFKSNLLVETVAAKSTWQNSSNGQPNYASIPEGDILVHCGEPSDETLCERLGENIIHSAEATFELIRKRSFSHVIYASSSIVYGDKKSGQRTETCTDTNSVNSVYARMKLAGELQTLDLGGTVLRLSNVYGDYDKKRNIINDVRKQLESNKLTIKIRNGEAVRDYTYISDVVDFIHLAAEVKPSGIFNVSTGIGTSALTLTQKICQYFGGSNETILQSETSTFSSIVLDPQKAKSLGWEPKYTLDEGLATMSKNQIS